MSNRLRQLREERGMTLKELVKDLERVTGLAISPDTLAKYEQGNREPKLERWRKLAKYFGVSVSYAQGVSNEEQIYQSFFYKMQEIQKKADRALKESDEIRNSKDMSLEELNVALKKNYADLKNVFDEMKELKDLVPEEAKPSWERKTANKQTDN